MQVRTFVDDDEDEGRKLRGRKFLAAVIKRWDFGAPHAIGKDAPLAILCIYGLHFTAR